MGLKILEIYDKCTACGACVSICPKMALSLQPQGKIGFYYPVVDVDKCVNCGLCEKTCHVLSTKHGVSNERHPYMLKAKDKELIKKSSSGGAFSLMADIIISDGGLVYGAAYNYEKEILEEVSTETCDVSELRKSKYIESYCGSIFKDVEEKLKSGRKVLFCGTPCQIKGLYHYLYVRKGTMDNIILVQFLCHGVPSNTYFTEYKHWLERQCKGKITDMGFRAKKYGWRTPYYYYYYGHGSKTVRGDATYYMSSFFKYYMLRESCYGCTIFDQGYADVTIADFWGLFKYDPKNKENEGLSLVIAHNEKGKGMINSICEKAEMSELPLSSIEYTRHPQEGVEKMMELRREMEQCIEKECYMPYMIRTLKKDVRKGMIKDFLVKALYTTHLWKTNK